MVTHWWINRYVLTDPKLYQPDDIAGASKEKLSLSLKESFLHIIHSKYLFCIALLVISYGICINMVEVTWKNQLRMQYPNPNEYNQFMGLFSTCTGIVTICMMLFVTNNVIRRFGWTVAALCTPVVLLITGSLFFCFVLFRDIVPDSVFLTLGVTPLMLTVMLGALQNIMSKSTNTPCSTPQRMSYIPLDPEQKVKGKAAVDVIGNPTGKSTGSVIQQVLMIALGFAGSYCSLRGHYCTGFFCHLDWCCPLFRAPVQCTFQHSETVSSRKYLMRRLIFQGVLITTYNWLQRSISAVYFRLNAGSRSDSLFQPSGTVTLGSTTRQRRFSKVVSASLAFSVS